MSNLRKKKKQETLQRILDAAQEVFLSQGYKKTTIATIAEKAGIGTGTFYNYFSSKSQLFLHIFFAKPAETEDKVNSVLNNPGNDVAGAIVELCSVYTDAIANINKELLKEVIEVFASDIEEHKKTMSEFIELDFQFIEQVSRLLSRFQARGQLTDTFNPEDAAQCIYAIFMLQVFMYVFEAEQPFELMKKNIIRQVKLFFSGKFA